MVSDVQDLLCEWHYHFAEHFVVEEVFAFEELHTVFSVVFLEIALAVDEFVLCAEESPDQGFFVGIDGFETVLLYLLERLNHLFVDLKLRCAVLSLIAEFASSQASEGEKACHVERGVDQYSWYSSELFGIEGAHAGGDNEVGVFLRYECFEEPDCRDWLHRHVRTDYLHAFRIEVIAHLRSRTCAAGRGKAVYVEYFFHAAKIQQLNEKWKV